MARVDEIAQEALSAVSSTASRVLASTWVNARYVELITKVRFKHTRRVGVLTMPAPVSAGTATLAVGASVVTGDSTARAAWLALPSVEGWHFRGATVWHRVVGRTPDGDLRLASAYTESALSAASYVLAQREHDLDLRARSPELFVHMRHNYHFRPIAPEFLDTLAPERADISSGPRYASIVGSGLAGGIRIELYPLSSQAETIHYIYRELPLKLRISDAIPSVIDGYILKEGVLIDVMRYEQAAAAHGGDVNAAALWRNDARAQETRWRELVNQAIIQDKGVDDATFVVQTATQYGRVAGPRDILSASDQVWSR